MAPVTLVVMERGSDWPARVESSTFNVMVLNQERHEPYGVLLRRTYDRICAIERKGGAITFAVLSCNDRRHTLDGRVSLARTLLASLVRHSEGRLVLVGRSDSTDHTRHSLTALAKALTEGLTSTSASVSTLFGAHEISFPRPERGLRASALTRGDSRHRLDKAG